MQLTAFFRFLHVLLLSHLQYNTLTKINETLKPNSEQKSADQNVQMRRLISDKWFSHMQK